ncbi:MetQ/NlpA family ABC transporter substrate-binding protein [Arcanobacterium hippocoleae]|uniref:MetQ/NlpA family ABC transporter substrate-binding protein n=1 Tax=Arcanobacterium hippocoleae TaxID=149017 RepID=UPI00333EC77D
MLEFVSEKLAKDAGIKLDIKTYTDYVQPNVALDSGDLDANFFQTPNYLEAETKEKGYTFEQGKGIHIEPLALYSAKFQQVSDIPDGATIVVNNDPANQARGLKLLEAADLLQLDADKEIPGIVDIKENPKQLKIVESEGAAIPVQLPDVEAAVINGNFALEAGLKPADSLFIEPAEDSPYTNILVWKGDNQKLAAIKKLDELLHSDAVKEFITNKYPDKNVIPAF